MLSKYKKILLLALLIRLLIMPFFYHPDLKSQLFHMQYLSQGVTNIYDFVDQNKDNLPYTNIYVYLPFTYYFFGSIDFALSPLYPSNLYTWLNDWGPYQNTYPNMIFFMLVLKIPYLIFDFLVGYILYQLYKNKKVLYFWFFNPISIYLIYILGNFDIIPAFLTLLAFYFIKKKKPALSYLSIGFAIALKMYPLIFLPFLFFYNLKKSFKIKNIFTATISLLPLIITVIPFLGQQSFYNSFIGSGLTQKILETKLLNIPVFPVFYFLIFINYLFSKSKYKFEIAALQTFLVFIGLVNFHPQWLMWFFPFLIIFFTKSSLKQKIFFIILFLLIFIYIFLFDDAALSWGHLIPIDYNFANLTSPYQLIKLKTSLNPLSLQQHVHTIILLLGLGGSIFYAKQK